MSFLGHRGRLSIVACVLALGGAPSCHSAAVAERAPKRPPPPKPVAVDTIEGCQTKPIETGLLVSCVADRFALELPGLSEGFVWSFRRPADPTQTHVIFVAEDSRKNADLYSLSVLVGPEADEGRNIASQLTALYDHLREETR